MRAALLRAIPARELALDEIPEPTPAEDEVLVAVSACGICGTDLHIMAGESYRPDVPFVLGHELAGTVLSCGGASGEAWIGERVVPTLFRGCGACDPCRHGDERLCERGARSVGVDRLPGGFAGVVSLAVNQLVRIPPALDDVVAASLVDAGATARNAARIATGDWSYGGSRALVLGVGPLGLIAAELLASAGREVVVVEANSARRAVAEERGFSRAATCAELEPGFAAVVDCAGDPAAVPGAIALLRPRGVYICAGYSNLPSFDLAPMARRELTLRGVRSGGRADLEDVLSLVAAGLVSPPPISVWPLDEINAALDALRDGKVPGKAVIRPTR